MVNEDIITSLRNAVNRGESLESAMNVMISSGYNQKDVQEAASFVGGGVLSQMQTNPDEQLTMPSSKTLFGKPIKQLPKSRHPKMPSKQPGPPQQFPINSQQIQPPQVPGTPQQQIPLPQLSKPKVPQKPALPNDPIQQPPPPPQLPQQPSQPVPGAVLPQLPNDPNIQPPPMSQQPSQTQQPMQGSPQQFSVQGQPLQSSSQPSQPIAKELQKIRPKKPTKTKEIILLLVLLCLIGVLIVTIVFRERIIGLFTG